MFTQSAVSERSRDVCRQSTDLIPFIKPQTNVRHVKCETFTVMAIGEFREPFTVWQIVTLCFTAVINIQWVDIIPRINLESFHLISETIWRQKQKI